MIRKKNYLKHYGVSIRDGAPGVGTGNWRRGTSFYERLTDPVVTICNKKLKDK